MVSSAPTTLPEAVYSFVPGVEVKIPALVQVQDLLHKIVSGEGNGLRRYTADVVERQATVQSLFNPVLIIYMLKGLCKGARQKNKNKNKLYIKLILE